MAGDADEKVQDEIMAASKIPKVEVLKVPHHGARTALREDFLKMLSPKLAIISVGKNHFGHPATELIEKLKSIGVGVLRTDREGEIEITTDGSSWARL